MVYQLASEDIASSTRIAVQKLYAAVSMVTQQQLLG